LPVQGQPSAPVTWVEFSDFQCPYCSMLYSQTDSQIQSNYVATGKVQMYFRFFPLSFHDKANIAAEAAACANEQGKFWEMHNKLFENQNTWSGASSADALTAFQGYATAIGLDSTKYSSCMSTNKYATDIAASETEGQGYGVQGTPGVFVILPKSKTDVATLKTVIASYGQGMTLYQDSDHVTVFVAGAYPYSAFSAILNTVTY
jgi:protein-disulfide isomerase